MRNMRQLIFLIIGAISVVGCSWSNGTKVSVTRPNPNGTKEERMVYHKSEMTKYRSASEREGQKALRSMSDRKMDQAREANNRKEYYLRKAEKHKRALKELEENRC